MIVKIVLFTFGVLGIEFKSAHMFEHLLYHKSTPLAKALNKMSKQAGCCRYKISLSVSHGVTEKLECVFTAVSHGLQAGSGAIKALHICRWPCWWQNDLIVEKVSRWSHSSKEMSRHGIQLQWIQKLAKMTIRTSRAFPVYSEIVCQMMNLFKHTDSGNFLLASN